MHCSCPHFSRGFVCKHLWAFLRTLDEHDAGPQVPGAGAIQIEELDAPEAVDAPEAPEAPDALDAPTRPPALEPSDRRRDWWLFTAKSAHPNGGRPAPTSDRRIYYVLSIERARPGYPIDVRLFESVRSANEDRLKPLTVRPLEIGGAWSREDQAALQTLADCTNEAPDRPDAPPLRSARPFHNRAIAPGLQPLVLPLLVHTGRLCRLPRNQAATRANLIPLRWDAERAFDAKPCLVPGRNGVDWQLVAELRGVDAPAAEEIEASFGNGLALVRDRIIRIEPPELGSFVDGFRRNGPIEVTSEGLPEFLERATERALPTIELPASLGWAYETGTPRGSLKIQEPSGRVPQSLLYADVSFVYPDSAGESERSFPALDLRAGFVDRTRRRILRRDLDRERALWQDLEDEGLEPPALLARDDADVQLRRSRMPEVVAALLARGWQVEAEGVRVRSASTTRLSVRSGIDWFGLEGEVAFDDQTVTLPELLLAARSGGRTVTLGDGSLGLLPTEWLERVAPLAALGEEEEDGELRFRPSQALLLDALLAAQPEIDVDATFRKACRQLERIGEPKTVRTPKGVHAQLRPYQKEGLGWLLRMSELGLGACLADDMGLGKTLQALALLVARKDARRDARRRARPAAASDDDAHEALPSLVVVPASLVQNWLDEAAQFTPDLSVLAYTGAGRGRLRDELRRVDLVVTTYATMRIDAAKLADQRFDCVILDEAQAIKNADAQVSKAARLLRARHRIALSGTPVENHLGELWALFDFLNPGMLGARARRARTLDDADADTISVLSRALAPFILRRTKSQVLKDLPQKTEQTIYCTLSGRDQRLYRELRDHYRESLLSRIDEHGFARSKIHVLEALLRLRQTACHPGLVDPGLRRAGSAKLDALFEQLDQALDEGHKALVFSQFTTLLGFVRQRLDDAGIAYAYLDGSTRNRSAPVRRFQEDPDCPVFLVSLKAGGQGLNLTAADYVFLLDPWWNPAVEAQAIDRAHRIGQTRPVFAYRIVARDTIEEKILELQEQKRQLADAIVSGTSSGLRSLSREDLEHLLE
jgi:superfamily II DNA or RNA helicase